MRIVPVLPESATAAAINVSLSLSANSTAPVLLAPQTGESFFRYVTADAWVLRSWVLVSLIGFFLLLAFFFSARLAHEVYKERAVSNFFLRYCVFDPWL